MPAPIEIVDPVDPVVVVRDLHADEVYVMNAFERHASHCVKCEDPYEAFLTGRTLCDRGHQYAIDVAGYLYSKNGKAHSVVDQELHQATLVKVPRHSEAVRSLLLAIEEGLRLHQRKESAPPVISYDQTYPIAPRRPVAHQAVPCNEIIEREPRESKRRHVLVYPSPRGSPSRGSLYDSDAVDRIERSYETSRVYRPKDYHR